MNEPARVGRESGAHLYLMQTTSGQLKIGRSSTPASRRRALETQSGRKVALVGVLPNQGHREADAHRLLASQRVLGEWFAFSPVTRDFAATWFGVTALPYPIGGKANRTRDASRRPAS